LSAKASLAGAAHGGHSAAELAVLARRLYVGGPYLPRKMAHLRIHICPFERLVSWIGPGSSVLDAGCGVGLFLGLLAATRPSIHGVGFDSSRVAIGAAQRMAERAKSLGCSGELEFCCLDVAEPWPGGRFHAVSLIDVLHHVAPAQQRLVFETAAGKVEPGGILLYKDMASRPIFPAAMNRLHDLAVARQWIHYVPVAAVEGWAAACGLTLVAAEDTSRFWYRHEMRVFRRAGDR
jgi:2-polyprenyl-3-methyl-5-hydroxy-6-metoxy-1,4-benzoquinol methylase